MLRLRKKAGEKKKIIEIISKVTIFIFSFSSVFNFFKIFFIYFFTVMHTCQVCNAVPHPKSLKKKEKTNNFSTIGKAGK